MPIGNTIMRGYAHVQVSYFTHVGQDYELLVNYGRSFRPLCQEATLPEPGPMNPEPLPPYATWKKRKVRTVKFEEYMQVEDVEEYLKKNGYEPADLWMLLTLAARFPDLQRTMPILATGTPVRFSNGTGELVVPCLRWDGFIKKQRFGTLVTDKKEAKRTFEFLPKQYGFEPAYYYLATEPL